MLEPVILKPVATISLRPSLLLNNIRAIPSESDLQSAFYIEEDECERSIYQIYLKIYSHKVEVGRRTQEHYNLYQDVNYLLKYGIGVNKHHFAYDYDSRKNQILFHKDSNIKIYPDPKKVSKVDIHFVLNSSGSDKVFCEKDIYWSFEKYNPDNLEKFKYKGFIKYPSLRQKILFLGKNRN